MRLHFLCIALFLRAEVLILQAVMKVKSEAACERESQIPEMQFHMCRVVSEIKEPDCQVSVCQLPDQNKRVRTSVCAEPVTAPAFGILGHRSR